MAFRGSGSSIIWAAQGKPGYDVCIRFLRTGCHTAPLWPVGPGGRNGWRCRLWGRGGEGEELPVAPPAKVGALELVAGALGSGGFALQQGAMARLPDELCGPAFNSQGDFQFVSGTYAVAWGAEAGKGCRRFLRSPRLSMDCCLTPWPLTS